MDRLDDHPPPGAASPSGPARSRKPPLFLKSNTFHHHHPSPVKELCRAGNGGGLPSPGAASPKLFLKQPCEEDPPLVGSLALRRSPSYASRSGRASAAAARWSPKVVLYTTSLRGVRQTFGDCCAVRSILRGFRVAVDERDVCMDASLRRELQSRLGCGGGKAPVSLPQVFIGERWVGGAEEIRMMFESGDLGKLLEGVARQDPRFVCRACGGVRFVPCGSCSGSRKVFDDEDGQLRRCPDCNENGLVRCADCC